MQNKNTPTEGQNSTKLEAESALRDAACSASSIVKEGDIVDVGDGRQVIIGKPERLIDLLDDIYTNDGLTLREHLANPDSKSPLKDILDAHILRDRQAQMS